MQIRPFLIKLKLKCRAWAVKFRPRLNPPAPETFFKKHWRGDAPGGNYFCTRSNASFFFSPNNRQEYAGILKKRFGSSIERAIASAEKIVQHKFDLLGSGETHLGERINWQLDFKSGFKWPLEHYTKIKIVDLSNNSDIKVPWELSRLQFVTTLGRAYWLTGDKKYKNKFMEYITDWDKRNPIDHGANWTCSMEIAIRAINIIWGLYFFGGKDELTGKFVQQVIRLLYYHGLHIERNLEYTDKGANSNHLISNYLGLFYLGLVFPEFDKSSKWLEKGKRGLEEEMLLQVNDDGADYECSVPYHRLVFEMFLSAYLLGKSNKINFNGDFTCCLTKMAAFSASMTAQSGLAPNIGDNDDGFVVKLQNDNPHDHRALLDIAAQVLDIKVPENVTTSEERLWYTGTAQLNRWPKMARRRPVLFKKSGYGIIQDDQLHLVLNACGIPPKAFGGHKHNDFLSINLEINKIPFLIDSGTACYSADYNLRNRSRSTLSHNTISIDGEEQNRFMEKVLFYMFNDSRPKIDLWTVTDDKVIVSATNDSYRRLGANIIHRRTLEVSLNNLTVDIWDEITGDDTNEHLIESRFLTPYSISQVNDSDEIKIQSDNGASLIIGFSAESKLHLQTTEADYYPRYGSTEVGTQICCKSRTTLPFKLETRLVYKTARMSPEQVNRVASLEVIK